MKSPIQVIRVSAARSQESLPSLSSWLDGVQVRMLAPNREALAVEADGPALIGGEVMAAELSDLVIRKIL